MRAGRQVAGACCDVTQSELAASGMACTGRTITVDASDQIVNQGARSMHAFAIHAQQRVHGAASYRVLRVANTPYFTPDPATQTFWMVAGPPFYDPTSALTDTLTHHLGVFKVSWGRRGGLPMLAGVTTVDRTRA